MSYQNTTIETPRPDTRTGRRSGHSSHEGSMAQFYIFKEEIHLGWDCFDKDTVRIGSGEDADLVLKGDGIADIHAIVHLKNGQIVIQTEKPAGQVLVNNRAVDTAILGRFDYIDVGPYTIKIKLLKSRKPILEEKEPFGQPQSIESLSKSDMPESDPIAAETPVTREETAAIVSSIDVNTADLDEQEILNQAAPAVIDESEKTIELYHSSDYPEGEADLTDEAEDPEKTVEIAYDCIDSDQTIELNHRIDDSEKTIELQIPAASPFRKKSEQPDTDHKEVENGNEPSEDRTDAFPGNEKKFSRKQYYPVSKDAREDFKLLENETPSVDRIDSGSGADAPAVPADTDVPENAREKYRVVYQGEVSDGYSYQEVRENLIRLFGSKEKNIGWIDSDSRVVVKKNISHAEAVRLSKILEKAGAVTAVENPAVSCSKEQETPEESVISRPVIAPVPPSVESPAVYTVEEDDEEEEDREAVFSLSDSIREATPETRESDRQINLEVTKFRQDTIVDVFFLKPGSKYHVRSQERKFMLAENDSKGRCRFCYSDHVWGTFQAGGSEATGTDHLKKTDKPFRARDGIYAHPMQFGDTVNITDGIFKYIIRPVYEEKSPEVTLPEQEEKIFHKYMIKSTIVHLFFLVFIGLFHSVRPPEPPLPETHFVKIDRTELSKIVQKKKPVPPPVVRPMEPEPAPKAKEIVKKEVVKKGKQRRPEVAAKKKPSGRKQVVSRSPKAGGGYGKGNISNRNVNQTGLLSMLGNSVGIKPQAAMAAVTNLDAVPSVAPKSANFKVGGIVGKLGKARIEIPTAGVVSTKGSTQVLRSAGAGGVGTVAALEKGKTGQKQVQGMVSAQLTKAVGIQGGMSREAVKRVIDQHLDEISYCYETALIANPSIMGKVVFEWKILTSGQVGMVNIKSSSINSSEIHSCIKSAIKTWQFPKPKGSEVIVSYPFVFDIVGF